ADGLIDRQTFVEMKENLLDEKKRLGEKITAAEDKNIAWLERFKEWVLTAQQLRKIAFALPPKQKRELALSIFGSNLTLAGKKATSKAVKPWSLIQNSSRLPSAVRHFEHTRTAFLENV